MRKRNEGTVCFLVQDGKVLLALIDHGEGRLLWNGVGGFVEDGESAQEGVMREVREEIGVEVEPNYLKLKKTVVVGRGLKLGVFVCKRWKGKPEGIDPSIVKLKWFDLGKLPFEKMHENNEEMLAGVFG